MFTADAAKFGIVPDQVRKFAALLHEIAPGKACDTLFKAGYAEQLAQHDSRILETQSLVEV